MSPDPSPFIFGDECVPDAAGIIRLGGRSTSGNLCLACPVKKS